MQAPQSHGIVDIWQIASGSRHSPGTPMKAEIFATSFGSSGVSRLRRDSSSQYCSSCGRGVAASSILLAASDVGEASVDFLTSPDAFLMTIGTMPSLAWVNAMCCSVVLQRLVLDLD